MGIPKRRIGTTLSVELPVLTEGEPISLLGRDISVVLVNPRGVRQHVGYGLAGNNVVTFIYQGKEQRLLGEYRVEVYENLNADRQRVFDKLLFELVQFSSMEEDGIDDLANPLIHIEAGNLSFGGKSAYEIAVEHGFTGTVEEWLASLKGEQGQQGEQGLTGPTGPIGPQGPKGDKGDTPVLSFEVDAEGYLKVTTDN